MDPPKFSKVRVAVRIRPLLPKEHTPSCVSLASPTELVIGQNRSFTFDKAFDASVPQSIIFDSCVTDLLQGFFAGYNATVLAYGQTGSGKTFTMGSANSFNVPDEDLGIIPRVIKSIFQEVDARKQKNECLLKVSFLEIYNEEILDLLDPKSGFSSNRLIAKKQANNGSVTIREEKDGSIGLYGLIEEKVGSFEEMLSCLERGSLGRSTSCTLMNETSSRSHAIFSITLEQHQIDDLYKTKQATSTTTQSSTQSETPEFITAKFHFVDLAGSERIKKTGATGNTLKEGININKGLLCLGNVIAALTENTPHHIPYRDSKLTRILQDSLGGNARTYMIACVSPAESNYDETLNTLKYASRARNIKNKPKINTDPNTALVNQMKQQIFELKEEILKYRMALKKHLGEAELQDLKDLKDLKEFRDDKENKECMGEMHELRVYLEPEDRSTNMEELKELRIKSVRYEKDILKLDAEKHVLRKELNAKEIDFFSIKRERDLLRLNFERLLEENKLEYPESDFENSPKIKLLDEYNNAIAKLNRDIEDKDVLLKEIQGEYEKLLGASARDQKLLLQKTEEIEILQKKLTESPRNFESQKSIIKEEHKALSETEEKSELMERTEDLESNTNLEQKQASFEELKTKEFLCVNQTTEKQLVLVDETIRMKEKLLKSMAEGQCALEQSLIEEMKQQYHQKIETLQMEIKNLEKERMNNEQSVDKKPINKQKLQDLEIQIRDFKKKEKMQSGLAKQVSLQKNQLDSLAEEIKAIKRQKIQLMKKLKEDTENFERWKASQMKKLQDLTRKNQEKDEQIQRLKNEFRIESKKSKEIAVKSEKSKSFCQRRSYRRGSSFLEENSIRNMIVNIGIELVKVNTKHERTLQVFNKEIEALESDQAELLRRVADIKLALERMALDKQIDMDFEEQENFNIKEQELMSQKRETADALESLGEKLRMRRHRLDEIKGRNPQKIEAFLEEVAKKGVGSWNDQLKEIVRGFYEAFGQCFSMALEKSEKAEQLAVEATEAKHNFDALDQKFKVSQAQYELNLTRITTEYEERCLFLIKQQNEQMMSTSESSSNEGKMGRKESENVEERKRMTSNNIRKNYEELVEKNLKLEKNLADIAKKQQGSDKFIQILKRKLEIVTDKYDQLKKQSAKEKYIGLPQQTQHKGSENNSFADLSGLLESPTKTPKKDPKSVGFSLTNLRDRRELKKVITRQEEYYPSDPHVNANKFNNSLPDSDIIMELETLKEKVRTESFTNKISSPLLHKKNVSLHISKTNSNSNNAYNNANNATIQSARPNFGGPSKEGKSSFSKHDANNSFEIGQNNNGSQIIQDINIENPQINEAQLEWKLKSSFEAHSAAVYAVCSYQNQLYSSSNKCFKVWSLDTLKPVSEISAHHSFIKTMIVWPEKRVLLTSCEKNISVWDMDTMKQLTSLKAHKDDIRCLHAYGDLLFSAGKGSISSGALFAWDLRTPNPVEEREKNQDIFSLLAHGNVLYYGSRNHQVCRLSLENSLEHMSSFESPHFDAVSSLTVVKNHLISGSRDKNLKLWSLEKSFSNNLHTAYAHQDWINVLEKNRQETMFYSGSRDGLIKVWAIQDNKFRCLGDLNSHSQSVNSVCNLHESYDNTIATGSSDKTIKLWKISPLEGEEV